MSGSSRDRAVERLLAVPAAGHSQGAAGVCVDAEVVAAWLDRGLSAADADAFESHVSACASCQELLAAVVRMTPVETVAATGSPASGVPTRSWRTWTASLAAAAALVLVVWTMRPGDSRVAAPATPKEESQIARLEAPQSPPLPVPESGAVPASPAAPSGVAADRADARRKAEVGSPAVMSAVPSPARAPSPSSAPAEPAEPAVPAFGQLNQRVDRQLAKVEEKAPAPGGAAPATVPAPAAALAGARPAQASRDVAGSAGLAVQSPGGESRWRVFRTVEFSSDGGATWRPVAGVSAAQPSDILFGASPAAQTAWLVGRGGLVLLTVDGLRFEVRTPPAMIDLTEVQATDRRTAVVRAATGQAWRTADGGRTWMPVR